MKNGWLPVSPLSHKEPFLASFVKIEGRSFTFSLRGKCFTEIVNTSATTKKSSCFWSQYNNQNKKRSKKGERKGSKKEKAVKKEKKDNQKMALGDPRGQGRHR